MNIYYYSHQVYQLSFAIQLVGCVDCHASQADDGTYIPVNEPGQFCGSCHIYTAVKIDCFSCHAAVPDAVVKQ